MYKETDRHTKCDMVYILQKAILHACKTAVGGCVLSTFGRVLCQFYYLCSWYVRTCSLPTLPLIIARALGAESAPDGTFRIAFANEEVW